MRAGKKKAPEGARKYCAIKLYINECGQSLVQPWPGLDSSLACQLVHLPGF